ncbi:MAG: YbjN domain-containing protein [Acidobacteriota bacterium]
MTTDSERDTSDPELERRLGVYLAELFDEVIEEEGQFYVSYGSTVLEIGAEEHRGEDIEVADGTTIVIMAYCVQGAEVDEELATALLEANHTLPFGAFSVVGRDIFFSHTLFADDLERQSLFHAVAAVAEISDRYDDRIVARFGGQRALDRIRGTGGRRRRREGARG